jgi:DNA invertase Pin-like site-specific DNA recombinase
MIAALYARVSTDEQARTGYSLGDQIRSCRERFICMGLNNMKEYIDDGYSGEFLERPALEQLRSDLAKGIVSHVLVYDPDRLSRNLTNQLILADEIEKSACQLLFVTGDYDASPEGRLFFSMRGAIAAFEKAKIRERTMRGKKAKVISGKPLFGRPPYGYSCDYSAGQYIIIPEEAEIVREIFNRYISKMYGVITLAADLQSSGYLNRSGKPFSISFLQRLLINEMYAGTKWAMKTYQKTIAQHKRKSIKRDKTEWVAIRVPAIIDRETWHKTVELRKQNKTLAKRNTKHEYLLSGIIKCSSCGYSMQGVTFPQRNNKDYSYYVCTAYHNGIKCDDRKCISSKEIDEAVWQTIINNYNKNIFLKKRKLTNTKDPAKIEGQLVKLRNRQTGILKWVAAGTIDMAAAEKELNDLTQQMNRLTEILDVPAIETNEFYITSEELSKATNFSEKRRILLRLKILIQAKKESDVITFTIRDTPFSK